MAERILIVDDDPNVLKALERVLRRHRYEILKANCGERALALLENNEVATIISDYNMPSMKGGELLEKAGEMSPFTGRIILTGVQDLHTISQAINQGQVSHFILKPWEEASLIQTVKTTVDRYRLSRRNLSLEERNAEQHIQLEQAHRNLKRELVVGGHIYERLLVGAVPSSISGFDVEAVAIPSKEIDGDFRMIYQPKADVLDVITGDVMGKGLPAALVATAVKMHLLRFGSPDRKVKVSREGKGWQEECRSIANIVSLVHEELFSPLADISFFVSLFVGRFDLVSRQLSFVDCGSPRPLHYEAEKKEASLLEGSNMPLGVAENEVFTERVVSFKAEDFFLFYSDGVTEMRNDTGEMYGVDRLKTIIKMNPRLPSKALLHVIQQSVLSYASKDTFDDDLTLVLVRFDPNYQPQRAEMREATFARDLSQLEAVRDFVSRACRVAPSEAEEITAQLQLAVNEAFVNLVKHGEVTGWEEIVVAVQADSQGILFELRDKGIPFDPLAVAEPSLSGSRDCGFGLFIIQEVADEVSYRAREAENDWNVLRIYKQFNKGEGMHFSHQKESQVLVINLEGESLDAKEAPTFKEEITRLVADEKVDNLVFNLRGLQFIDSSGLGSFLSVLRHVNNRGGDLKLACMTKPIRTMFEVVRMHKLFEIFNSTDDAVRSFAKG